MKDHSGDTDYDMAGTEFGYDPTGNVISDNSDDLGTNTIVTWTPDNKLLRTLDNDNERETENLYDAMGNLVRRRSHQNWNAQEVDILTFYIRDATGNVIATYEMDMLGSQSLDVKERYIYGAEKIAVLKGPNSVSGTTIDHLPAFQYLIHDHLGNQRVMVADKGSPGDIEIKSFSNIYAFGAPHPERSYNLLDARFGFNGQEKVDLIKGIGLHYNAKFWEYDAVYGRRWNLDPKPQISISDYAVVGNNPITNIDPLGDWFWERSNVRQARQYARQTRGEFTKWKDADGRTQASVNINSEDGAARSFLFTSGRDRSDLLQKSGVGFYKTMLATHSGRNYVKWLMRGLDAWSRGRHHEFDRNGQAPGFAKGVAGLNTPLSVTNAIIVLATEKDIYNVEASSSVDKTLARTAILVPFLPKPTRALLILEDIHTGVQFANDAGALDSYKTQKSEENLKNDN